MQFTLTLDTFDRAMDYRRAGHYTIDGHPHEYPDYVQTGFVKMPKLVVSQGLRSAHVRTPADRAVADYVQAQLNAIAEALPRIYAEAGGPNMDDSGASYTQQAVTAEAEAA